MTSEKAPPGWDVEIQVDRYDQGSRIWHEGEMVTPTEAWHLAKRGDVQVWFRMAKTPGGRYVCTEVDVRSESPISTSVLRSIPISAIAEHLASKPIGYMDAGGPYDLRSGIREWYDYAGVDTIDQETLRWQYIAGFAEQPPHARPSRGGNGPSRAELERFAEAYRVALRSNPRRAMAETVDLLGRSGFHISVASAHRWRKECRQVGLLPNEGRQTVDQEENSKP